MQQSMHDLPPYTRWQAAGSLVGSKARYGIASMWLRSPKSQLNSVRFYYGMAVASVLGLSTIEALGVACCDKQSVGIHSEINMFLIWTV